MENTELPWRETLSGRPYLYLYNELFLRESRSKRKSDMKEVIRRARFPPDSMSGLPGRPNQEENLGFYQLLVGRQKPLLQLLGRDRRPHWKQYAFGYIVSCTAHTMCNTTTIHARPHVPLLCFARDGTQASGLRGGLQNESVGLNLLFFFPVAGERGCVGATPALLFVALKSQQQ